MIVLDELCEETGNDKEDDEVIESNNANGMSDITFGMMGIGLKDCGDNIKDCLETENESGDATLVATTTIFEKNEIFVERVQKVTGNDMLGIMDKATVGEINGNKKRSLSDLAYGDVSIGVNFSNNADACELVMGINDVVLSDNSPEVKLVLKKNVWSSVVKDGQYGS